MFNCKFSKEDEKTRSYFVAKLGFNKKRYLEKTLAGLSGLHFFLLLSNVIAAADRKEHSQKFCLSDIIALLVTKLILRSSAFLNGSFERSLLIVICM